MQSMGHSIGAHGHGHEPYTRMSPAQRREDLRRVSALLSERLGRRTYPLSYPFGRFNEDTLAACREAGFEFAFTTQRAWTRVQDKNLALPRVDAADVPSEPAEDAA
jgi:peptidoglycan/xylan/chitin deacetylase (PgdA/CDA1 family)